eukprot:6335039-Amphidinium_carterae.1
MDFHAWSVVCNDVAAGVPRSNFDGCDSKPWHAMVGLHNSGAVDLNVQMERLWRQTSRPFVLKNRPSFALHWQTYAHCIKHPSALTSYTYKAQLKFPRWTWHTLDRNCGCPERGPRATCIACYMSTILSTLKVHRFAPILHLSFGLPVCQPPPRTRKKGVFVHLLCGTMRCRGWHCCLRQVRYDAWIEWGTSLSTNVVENIPGTAVVPNA